ncbi:MAG: iron-containing alcohol dehydrogenase [Prevotellaceae bacterium]|jgi:NADP-dependent alcohol dehydrogenase|nr:iron-containing alcohol dehydrogenase [Prevotellaceae bacterium]
MNNFTYQNPVKIIFGRQTIAALANEIPAGAKVMMAYGGGSIKANGVYEQVKAALKGFDHVEFGGIEPNPHYETCMKAVELARRERVTFLLAVGGGSVLDGVKLIAAALYCPGDAWETIIVQGAELAQVMPIGAVLTLPATGSEMNGNSVITRAETCEKLSFSSPAVYPRFSILDPETTYSLPPRQLSNGVVDTFVHVCEQYINPPASAPLQDFYAESILKVLVDDGPKALATPCCYELRANLMWAATMALNGLIACGVPEDWRTHSIGHELTALHGLDHGQSLAVVMPGVWRTMLPRTRDKLLQMGERVFGIATGTPDERVQAAIDAVENFFRSMGTKTRLTEYGLTRSIIEPIAQRFAARGGDYITADMVRDVLGQRV